MRMVCLKVRFYRRRLVMGFFDLPMPNHGWSNKAERTPTIKFLRRDKSHDYKAHSIDHAHGY
jgi:hypothetical protein